MSGYENSAILLFMRQGKKIDAIKELRTATGLGLKEAKDIIELFWDSVTGSSDWTKFQDSVTGSSDWTKFQQAEPAGSFDQKPYREETYHVFSRDWGETSWVMTYTDSTKAYALDDAKAVCDNGREALLVQVVAKSKYVIEEV